MATVNKNFKIKSGLVVEGTTATVNGYDVLTKKTDDQNYIVNLIGGTATSANEADKVVKRDGSGNFAAGTITADLVGDVTGNADTATALETARTIQLTGDVTGSVSFDGTANVQISTTLDEDFATDAELSSAISTEVSDRNSAISSAISTEVTNRNSAISSAISTEVTNRNNAISSAISTEVTDRNNAISDAISTEVSDRNDAISDAITALDLSNTYDALGAAGIVQDNLDDHATNTSTHGVTGNIVGTTDTQTISNKTLGSDLAAGGYKVSGLATPTANADAATKSYVDSAVAGLVDSAPELLDTLNELAAAIGDDENFISTVTTSIGEKVAKAGDSMTGNLDFGGTNKVTSLGTPTSNGDAANKQYVDNAQSAAETYASGVASDAYDDAVAYADSNFTKTTDLDSTVDSYGYLKSGDIAGKQNTLSTGNGIVIDNDLIYIPSAIGGGLNVTPSIVEIDRDTVDDWYDANGAASSAQSAAEGYASGLDSATNTRIDNLDTDDIAEGSHLYFTDARAKSSAADLLTGAQLTNITITGSGAGLTITAENGVADSDTDDLDEGSTNLYFTDQRAIDAISGETISPNIVEITWARKEKATYTYVPTVSTANVFTWNRNEGASAKFLVRVKAGTHSQVSEVLTTVDDSNNVAITEYGTVGTNGNLGNISATYDANSSEFALTVETTENNSEVFVAATLLSYTD